MDNSYQRTLIIASNLKHEILALNRTNAILLQEINQLRIDLDMRGEQTAKRLDLVENVIKQQADRLQAMRVEVD